MVVSTLDRPEHVVDCARSILAEPGDDFELIVVDQSPPTAHALSRAALGNDPRLRWVSSSTRGLSCSRNIAVGAARGPVIAFTDDDCRVPSGWQREILTRFDSDPDLALLFGRVFLRPEDREKGYAAEFEPSRERTVRGSLPSVSVGWGVGANMAIRRSVFDRVGLFDSMLGAGAPLQAAEEISNRVGIMSHGKLLFNGTVQSLGERFPPDQRSLESMYLALTEGDNERAATP